MNPQAQLIPPPIQETLDWLIQIEDFPTVRGLARTTFKRLPPDNPESWDFLAKMLFKSKHYKEAAEAATRTLELVPHSPDANFNAGKCLNSAARPVEAERAMREAIRLRPGWVDPMIDLAVYVCAQGRIDEAYAMLQSIFPKLPSDDKNVDVVRFNLGWHEIRRGNFKLGMDWLGIGRKLRIWGARTHRYTQPILTNQADLRGKTVLLCGEGGAGDEIINARFARVIRDRGGRAIWSTQHGLQSLFARYADLDGVMTAAEAANARFDYWAPCMDLPRILELELEQVPSAPFLSADPAHVRKWAAEVRDPRRLKVGLRWQGNALYEQDLMRSVPFKLLEGLLEIPGVDFYSLQRDEGAEERPADSPVADWGTRLRTWEDTAGAIANLDLVISSCTSVPHLAGALGKPTWIFCPINPYYLWATPGESSAWYPSVRLFRQEEYGNWDATFSKVRLALADQLRISSMRNA